MNIEFDVSTDQISEAKIVLQRPIRGTRTRVAIIESTDPGARFDLALVSGDIRFGIENGKRPLPVSVEIQPEGFSPNFPEVELHVNVINPMSKIPITIRAEGYPELETQIDGSPRVLRLYPTAMIVR